MEKLADLLSGPIVSLSLLAISISHVKIEKSEHKKSLRWASPKSYEQLVFGLHRPQKYHHKPRKLMMYS